MKKLLIISIVIFYVHFAQSQTTEAEATLKTQTADTTAGWNYGGTINTTLSQVSLTNWSAGGQNSISVNGLLSLFTRYKKGNMLWENYLDLAYGTVKQGNDKDSDWMKSDDKFDFTSKYGQKASKSWYYAGLVNLKTQMTAGYNYPNKENPISKFLAPGYLLGAIGMDYKPNDNFTAFLSPLTGKVTIVNDQTLADAGAFGVEPGEKIRSEFGGYARFFVKYEIMKNVSLQSKLDLFSNYLENPQNIDINWETLISLKVNKYISATIMTHLIYDDDIDIVVEEATETSPAKLGPRVQFKEVLGVGFSYKF
jgi:hypothetical protein